MYLQPDVGHHSRGLCDAGEDNFSLVARSGKACLVLTNKDDDA
jgi:hypothetical protein